MEKYFLITVSRQGYTSTFIETGTSVYDAFITNIKNRRGQLGYIYTEVDSIIYSSAATHNDYRMFQVLLNKK